MLTRRSLIGLLAATPLLARPAFAATPEVYADGGFAIRGTDPVAYFRTGGPARGSDAHMLMWRGATWAFTSAENMSAFEMDPEAYAPQYGGYCAYAVSQGYTASTDPDAWTIHEGKLYLNYSISVRSRWERDIPGHIAQADANWPGVLS